MKLVLAGWRLPLALVVLAVVVSFECPSASAQPPWGGSGEPLPDRGSRSSPVAGWNELLVEAKGILIVDGQHVAGPYQVALDESTLKINDLEIRSSPPEPESGPRGRRLRSEAEIRRSAARRLGEELVNNLANGMLVVALPDQPLVAMTDSKSQCDLLAALLAEPRRAVTPVSVTEHYAHVAEGGTWDAWIAAFVPTADFRETARARIELYDRSEAEARAAIAATRRLQTFSYPLSVLGMVVTTLGIGHLLSHRPPVGAKSLETDASPLAIQVLTWSLVLVVIYSVLDLTWTILAHQAGQMLELNPLGSRLMDDPLKLIAFKGAATGMAVVLLFALRKYRKAQLAAWWVCLVCTLLTARWLTLSPMFVA
jgi:hypothetical protein